MDTGQLNAFVKVAEHLSFSKASEELFLTQSAVSKRISTLESELDITLFERFGQHIQLTIAGAQLLSDAREILDTVQQMHHHSSVCKTTITGKLRVATSHHIGLYRLPKILQEFIKVFPNIQFDMHFLDSEVAYEGIAQGRYDIAIATLPNSNSGLSASVIQQSLWHDELVIMFSNNHVMAQHQYLTANELAHYPSILPDESTFTRRIIDSVFEAQGISYHLAFTTNYLETIKVMVETGMGWSVLPTVMQSEKLTVRDVPYADGTTQAPARELGLILHKNKVITPALRAFIRALEDWAEVPTNN